MSDLRATFPAAVMGELSRSVMVDLASPASRDVVRKALDEGRVVLMTLFCEPESPGRFPGYDFQRIIPAANQRRDCSA